MLTTKSLILTTDPVSVLSTTATTELFKTQSCHDDSLVYEYNGSSDVTSDQSTDLSPSLSEEEEVDDDDKRLIFPPTTINTATSTPTPIDGSNNSICYHEKQGVMQQQNDISPIQLQPPSTTTDTTTTSLLLSSSHFVPIVLERDIQDCISVSMLDIYERLLPTRDAYERRRKFVTKVETILGSEWKDHDIRVHLFGSSENNLGTSTSDVDICLTTSWPGLKCVRTLATVLKKHGMQKVHTVPRAKVPIVKMWDPIYQLACDMNVNSSLALHNTRMIKTYVAIDPRVRPLAMLIKYWTRQRALNNAADGGTLSTYTWTCMIISFLQMREPPILPVLHHMEEHYSCTASTTTRDPVIVDGLDISFYSDVESLRYFGERNHESLGGLLFAFFRRFAYEFDYETQVVSVRHGRYLSKQEKGWHEGPNKRLFCIEEPFNVHRNLGNSADDASVYGLQAEFRRAVHILLETKSLEALCAKHVSTRPPSLYLPLTVYSNPVLPLSSSSSPVLLPTCHHFASDPPFVTTATATIKNNNDNMTKLAAISRMTTPPTKIANTTASPSSHYSHKKVSNSNITTNTLPHVMPMTRMPSSASSVGHSSGSSSSNSSNSSNSDITNNTSNSSSSKSFSALSPPTQPLPSAQLIPMFHHNIPSDLTPNNNNNCDGNSDTTTPVHHYMYHPHPLPPPPATTTYSINNNNNNSITSTNTSSTNTNQHHHYQHYPYYVYYHSNKDTRSNDVPDNVYNQQQKHKEQKQSKLRRSYTPNFGRNQLQQQQQQQPKKQGGGGVDRHRFYMELSQQQNNQQQSRQQQSRKNNNKSRNNNKSSSTITPPLYKRQQRLPQQQLLPQYANGNNANTIRRSFWDNNNCNKNHYHNSKKGRGKQQRHSFKSTFDNGLASNNNVNFVYFHYHPQIMK